MKTMTIKSNPVRIKQRIKILEESLKNAPNSFAHGEIKKELTALYKLRKKQKNYTPPPPKNKSLTKGL